MHLLFIFLLKSPIISRKDKKTWVFLKTCVFIFIIANKLFNFIFKNIYERKRKKKKKKRKKKEKEEKKKKKKEKKRKKEHL